MFYHSIVSFAFPQVINARHNELKNHGVPSEMFKLDDLLTVVKFILLRFISLKKKIFSGPHSVIFKNVMNLTSGSCNDIFCGQLYNQTVLKTAHI